VKGRLFLVGTLLAGVMLDLGAATLGSPRVAPYLPRSFGAPVERIQGEVLRKQREATNRLPRKLARPRDRC
jgi:hypothetical protein